MTLQGPNLSLLGSNGPSLAGPLAGPADLLKEHPWAIIVGLLAGGWLASKYAPAWGGSWGASRAAHARATAFHGASRRRPEKKKTRKTADADLAVTTSPQQRETPCCQRCGTRIGVAYRRGRYGGYYCGSHRPGRRKY